MSSIKTKTRSKTTSRVPVKLQDAPSTTLACSEKLRFLLTCIDTKGSSVEGLDVPVA